jgi:hypothetical protein
MQPLYVFTTIAGIGAAISAYVTISEFLHYPTDNFCLPEEEFENALQSGNLPDLFRDPVFFEVIHDPVMFKGDPNKRTFERKTAETLLQVVNPVHPFTRKPLDRSQMVSLPRLKAQIDRFVQRHPET